MPVYTASSTLPMSFMMKGLGIDAALTRHVSSRVYLINLSSLR